MTSLTDSFQVFSHDIKLAHSVFALPFAMAAVVLLDVGLPSLDVIAALLLAMISARTFAMGCNRLIDAPIDRLNPRTAQRAVASGQLSRRQSKIWCGFSAVVFVLSAFSLNQLAGFLSVPLLAILAGYSFTKRFTQFCHYYLGMCLGLAPIGVAVALTGTAPVDIIILGVAICCWTAGFDILYALQDREFDSEQKLHSIPVRWGPKTAIYLSRMSFLIMISLLSYVGIVHQFGWVYFAGVSAIAFLLIIEHFLVRDALVSGQSRNINVAFFNVNAAVSVIYYLFLQAEVLLR